jgi:hypothetical protein
MRHLLRALPVLVLTAVACAQQASPTAGAAPSQQNYAGFDANDYPGDAQLPALRRQFAFTGYWLTNPPGANANPWAGKREILLRSGFGFLVVANGRLDKEILRAQKSGKPPAAFARKDADAAVAAAQREGFPPGTIIFLDQEEGGRMLPEQAGYLLAWTEAVARTAYRPGVYASGQPVPDGKGPDGRPVTITTIQDIREHVAAQHLHPIAFWVAQDACPPAPGCAVPARPPSPDLSGILNADAWQYSQSPRRKNITQACGATYASDGNCYAPGIPHFQLDLSVSASPDPSHGR